MEVKNFAMKLNNSLDINGNEVGSSTPDSVEVEVKKPLTVEEQIQKHLLKQQYLANLSQIAERMKAGEDIDDEYDTDEDAFTAAEKEYVDSQAAFREKREKYFKAAEEKKASEIALGKERYAKKVQEEALKLGLIPQVEPDGSISSVGKASGSAQG